MGTYLVILYAFQLANASYVLAVRELSIVVVVVLSQVILSVQLAFAVVPLVLFTSDRNKMGEFANSLWLKILAWLATVFIIVLNAKLLFDAIRHWLG